MDVKNSSGTHKRYKILGGDILHERLKPDVKEIVSFNREK